MSTRGVEYIHGNSEFNCGFTQLYYVRCIEIFKPFKREPHKIVKHTQTIRRLLPKNCLSVTILLGWRLES